MEEVRKRRKKGEGRLSEEIKLLRNSGKPYITKSNVLKPGKQPLIDTATCKCKYKCKSLQSNQQILLFNELYAVDHQKQQNYLLGLINVKPVARRRHGNYDNPTQSRRQATAIYTVPNGEGELIQVCKGTFRKIFSLSEKRVQGLVTLKQTGNPMYTENRGNKIKHRKFSESDKQTVCEHINSIPREISHYGRTKTNREYLSSDLNITRLYRSFKKKYPDTPITYRFYYLTFKENFSKLSFHAPRTDTCAKCDLLAAKIKASEGNEKNVLIAKQKLHHLKAENARKSMKDDYEKAQQPTSNKCGFK